MSLRFLMVQCTLSLWARGTPARRIPVARRYAHKSLFPRPQRTAVPLLSNSLNARLPATQAVVSVASRHHVGKRRGKEAVGARRTRYARLRALLPVSTRERLKLI